MRVLRLHMDNSQRLFGLSRRSICVLRIGIHFLSVKSPILRLVFFLLMFVCQIYVINFLSVKSPILR